MPATATKSVGISRLLRQTGPMRAFWLPLFALLTLAALTLPAGAAEERLRLYVFGNSLINHPSDSPDTNVPVWLARMARTDGRHFAMDGQFGFLTDFAGTLPPAPGWSFRGVRGVWRPARRSFAEAGFDKVMIAPANFIQYQPPDAPYERPDANGASPLSALLAVIDWVESQAPGTPVMLYEGWAEMAPFADEVPTDPAYLSKYYLYNSGEYHEWYEALLRLAQAARPEADLRLVPVAKVLAQLLSDGPLASLPPTALYTDSAPHGTPTLYLLAAMISYASLFDAPPPEGLRLPESIEPALREHYPELAQQVWQAVANATDTATDTGASADTDTETSTATAPPAPAASPPPPALRDRLDTGLADPALAMGLNGIADWSSQQPFLNIVKTARGWIGHRADQWGAWGMEELRALGLIDENGWPTGLPEGATHLEALILTDQPEASAPMLAGRYRVTWQGSGKLRLLGRVSDVTMGDHEAWFSYSPGDGAVGLGIYATDPERTGDNIRNIVVLREEYIPLWQAGAVFNPDWLAVIGPLRALRFMDWMQTNNSTVTSWADRPRPDDFSYASEGVPLEVMVQLANEVGADPWFNMPHMADDDYVRRSAEYVKAHLDPRLVAHVEYSNEIWNFTFRQALWAEAQAKARWGAEAGRDGWMQFAGARAAEVMDIWADVFDAEAPARLKRVLAVHTGWPGLEQAQLTAPLAVAAGAKPPAASFDAYAVSGYFGLELGTDDMAATIRDWIALPEPEGLARAARALREGSLAELLNDFLPYHARIAAKNGLELIMYEGGTHVVAQGAQREDAAIVDFFTRLNYSDEMAAIYQTLLDGWRAAGGTLFNAFVDVAQPTKYGSWGALRFLGDDNPRWQTLARYNATGAGWEARPPGTFRHGVLRVGSNGTDLLEGTDKVDSLLGMAGDDVLISNGGADHLNGGEGFDIAILSGTPEAYDLTREGARILARGPDGTISLFAVEALQFMDAPGTLLRLDRLP